MRQYVAPKNIDSKGFLEITGKDYRYFRSILRLCVGDMIDVRLPSGELKNMTLCSADEKKHIIKLQICDTVAGGLKHDGGKNNNIKNTDHLDIWLFQFIAKSAKMDLIIRQAVECGVSTIVPVIGEFCQAGTTEKNFRSERIERIIKEARQQSGSPVDTRVVEPATVEQAVKLWKNHTASNALLGCSLPSGGNSLGIVLYERKDGTMPLHVAVGQKKEVKCVAVACGAEGGISSAEIEIFESGGFIPVHFDTNILRCETAALYGIAALQSAVTENNIWQCKE